MLSIFLAINTNFTFDEILSWLAVREAKQIGDIFLIFHDNNHILNSLWLYFFSASSELFLCRLLSLVAGLLSIITILKYQKENYSLLILFVSSIFTYWFLARGYSLIIFASIYTICFIKDEEYKNSRSNNFLAFIVQMLGLLGHPGYLVFLLFIGIYLLLIKANKKATPFIFAFLPAFFYYYYFIARLPEPSNPVKAIPYSIIDCLSFLIGGPATASYSVFYSILSLAAASVSMALLYLVIKSTKYKDRALLLGLIISYLLANIIVSKSLTPRYFIVIIPVLFLIVFENLSVMKLQKGFKTICCLIFTINFLMLIDLYVYKTGAVNSLLTLAIADKDDSEIKIAGDVDIRISPFISFFNFQKKSNLVYEAGFNQKRSAVDWIFGHHLSPAYKPPDSYTKNGVTYELVKQQRASLAIGFKHYLYKRVK